MRLSLIFLMITISLILLILIFQLSELLPFAIVCITISLFLVSSKRPLVNRTFRILSLFIFLHLIIFPFAYLKLLNEDSTSFELDDYINKYEKEYAIQNIKEKIKPDQLKIKIELIDSLLSEKSKNLTLSLSEIYTTKNIYSIDDYLINGKVLYEIGAPPGGSIKTERIISVYEKNGKFIQDLKEYSGSSNDSIDKSFFEFLIEERKNLSRNLLFLSELENNKNDKFWSYPRILPYVINIFNTDNIKPKSRIANILFFAHYFIVIIFIVGLFVSSIGSGLNQKI